MSLNNTFEKTSLIAIGILVGVLAACSPLLSTNNASAAGSPKRGCKWIFGWRRRDSNLPGRKSQSGALVHLLTLPRVRIPHYIMIIAGVDDRIEGAITQVTCNFKPVSIYGHW